MRHFKILEGYGCRLRPVRIEDALKIIDLRRSSHAVPFLGDTSPNVDDQRAWLKNYFDREGDYYWIIEDIKEKAVSVGTVSLYDITDRVGITGRWVQIPCATFSAVAPTLLMYRFAFDNLNLLKLRSSVVSTNYKVLRFHRMLGEREVYIEKEAQEINGVRVDLIWFEVLRDEWTKIYDKWHPLVLDEL